MWRLATVIDDSTHIWRDDPPTETYCGVTNPPRRAKGRTDCPGCIRVFGAEAEEAYPEYPWLTAPGANTRHAFEPGLLQSAGTDHVRPVCSMYNFAVFRLQANPHLMRCPSCVKHFELRENASEDAATCRLVASTPRPLARRVGPRVTSAGVCFPPVSLTIRRAV
jgi:hypothetical protein